MAGGKPVLGNPVWRAVDASAEPGQFLLTGSALPAACPGGGGPGQQPGAAAAPPGLAGVAVRIARDSGSVGAGSGVGWSADGISVVPVGALGP
jgi:hypothetical protein